MGKKAKKTLADRANESMEAQLTPMTLEDKADEPLRDTTMKRSLSNRLFVVPHIEGYPPELNLYFGTGNDVVYLPFQPEAALIIASQILEASKEHAEWLKSNTTEEVPTQTEDPQKQSK